MGNTDWKNTNENRRLLKSQWRTLLLRQPLKKKDSHPIMLCMTRVAAIHVCSPDIPFFRFCHALLTQLLPTKLRSRLQFHTGEPLEVRYALNAYGIPLENLTVTWTGKVNLNYFKQWMKLRHLIESKSDDLEQNSSNKISITAASGSSGNRIIVECPNSADVIFRL